MQIEFESTSYYAYTASHSPQANKQTIVFIHGTSMDHTVWSLQSRYFAYHGYNILALDLPGHGLSGGSAMDKIEDYAAWVVKILSQSIGSRFHLVGHSMGALIALEACSQYDAQHPPSASLSLVGFSYPMTVTPQLLDAAENDPSQAYSMMTQWSHTSPIGGEPNPGFWSAGSQMSMMHNSRPGTVFTDLTACNNYSAGAQAFDSVTCPILFVSGVMDKMAPSKLAKSEADRNANAQIVLLPNCGHSILSENPDGVRNSLKEFIGNNS